jgi:hypothetical protein
VQQLAQTADRRVSALVMVMDGRVTMAVVDGVDAWFRLRHQDLSARS